MAQKRKLTDEQKKLFVMSGAKNSFGKYIFTKKDADSLLNKIAAIKYASETIFQ